MTIEQISMADRCKSNTDKYHFLWLFFCNSALFLCSPKSHHINQESSLFCGCEGGKLVSSYLRMPWGCSIRGSTTRWSTIRTTTWAIWGESDFLSGRNSFVQSKVGLGKCNLVSFLFPFNPFPPGVFVLSNMSRRDSSSSIIPPVSRKIEINSSPGCWHGGGGAKLYFLEKTLIYIQVPKLDFPLFKKCIFFLKQCSIRSPLSCQFSKMK